MEQISSVIISQNYITVILVSNRAFKLSQDMLLQSWIQENEELSLEQVQLLANESERFLCMEKAVYYLSMRSTSTSQLRQYLVHKKKFSKEAAEVVLKSLTDKGYLNDKDYAERFAQSRFNNKVIGKERLRSDLYKKGIDRSIIDGVLQEIDESTQSEALMELARKKLKSIIEKPRIYEKMVQFLMRRGFEYDRVKKTVEQVIKEEGIDPYK